jgi:hypothetical protein
VLKAGARLKQRQLMQADGAVRVPHQVAPQLLALLEAGVAALLGLGLSQQHGTHVAAAAMSSQLKQMLELEAAAAATGVAPAAA